MSKRRKEIRNEVVSILKRSNIVSTDSIRANRSIVLESKTLPAISVYTRSDEVAVELSQAPRLLRKHLDLVIEVYVMNEKDDKAADYLDDLCEKIEDALTTDDSLDKKCSDIILSKVEFDYEGEKVDKPYHTAILIFNVKYEDYYPRDRFNQKTDDFLQANAEWQVGHNDGEPTMPTDDRAKDEIDLPQ